MKKTVLEYKRLGSTFVFVKNLFTNFNTLGEIAPYSTFTSNKIIKHGNISNSINILEIGPGLGKFTKNILREAGEDSKITVVEKLSEFSDFLNKNLIDRRLKVINGDILDKDIYGQLKNNSFDTIVSSIPISFLKPSQRMDFANIIKKLLKTDGIFINAQYSLSSKKYFESVGMRCDYALELRNIPPTFIFICKKR